MKVKAKWDNKGHWKKGQVFTVYKDRRGKAFVMCDEGRHFLTDPSYLVWESITVDQIYKDDQFEQIGG